MRRVYILVALNIMVGAGAWAYDNTLTVVDTISIIKLRLQGVRTIRTGPLESLLVDNCQARVTCHCVALVHGLGDTAMTWSDTLLAAPDGFRVYAPNMPGTEGSPRPNSPDHWRVSAQAGVLQSVLSNVKGCESWTVAGNSLGGWTSSWLSLKWPQGVEKLVLVNSAGLKDSTGASRRAAEVLAQPTIASLKEFGKLAYHKERPAPERIWPDLLARILKRGTFEIASALKEDDFLDGRLGALQMPVTVLWGESDGVIPPGQAFRFKAEIPHAKIVMEKNCGHLPQKECPASLLAEIY